MIKRFLFYVFGVLASGAGSWLVATCRSNNEILSLKQSVILKNDTLGFARDSILVLRGRVSNLEQADSSNRFFIVEKEKVLIEQRNIIRSQLAELKVLIAWKMDAMDGIIIQVDTVRLRKKGLFGMGGYKVMK